MTNGNNGNAIARVLVTMTNQASMSDNEMVLQSQYNVAGVTTPRQGVFQVEFSDVFNDFPVVTVTQHFNGNDGDNLNSVTEDLGLKPGHPQDNAVVLFVAPNADGSYFCQVLTGYGTSQYWRSFSIFASGPAK